MSKHSSDKIRDRWFSTVSRDALKSTFSKPQRGKREPTGLGDVFPGQKVLGLDKQKTGLRVTSPSMFSATGGGWWRVPAGDLTPAMRKTKNNLKRNNLTRTPLGRAIAPLLKGWSSSS